MDPPPPSPSSLPPPPSLAATHGLAPPTLPTTTATTSGRGAGQGGGGAAAPSPTLEEQRTAYNKLSWEGQAQKLIDTTDREEQQQYISELRERFIENFPTSDYSKFLECMLPAFEFLLNKVPPQSADNTEHKIRHAIMDVLERLHQGEHLKPYKEKLLALCIEVLKNDNEDNGVIAAKVLSNLHKAYRQQLEAFAQPCLDLVINMYTNLPESTATSFEPSKTGAVLPLPPASGLPENPPALPARPLSSISSGKSSLMSSSSAGVASSVDEASKSTTSGGEGGGSSSDGHSSSFSFNDSSGGASTPIMEAAYADGSKSFKVLAECPLLVMILFSYYPQVQNKNSVELIALAVQALELRPPSKASHLQRSLFRDFLALQIKTLNFLSWNRPQVKLLVKYKDNMINSVVWLLRACPGEFVSNRKELLMAARYMIQSELRDGFLAHVDVLLDEKTLEGEGGRPNDALRTSALNMLSEIVSPLREKLSLHQLSAVIYLFSKHVHDATLPLATQTLSVRVILHLVDSICRWSTEEGAQQGRKLLVWILKTLVSKFGALRAYLPRLEAAERMKAMEQEAQDMGALRQLPRGRSGGGGGGAFITSTVTSMPAPLPVGLRRTNSEESSSSVGTSSTIGLSARRAPAVLGFARKPNPAVIDKAERAELGDTMRAAKDLIKTMMVGLKTVIWCLINPTQAAARAQGQPVPTPHTAGSHPLSEEERDLLAQYFKWALICLRVYSKGQGGSTPAEAKEIFELFVGALLVMEPQNVRGTVGRHLELYFNVILQDLHFLAIAQQLVSSNATMSAAVADMLLHFLMARLADLSGEMAVIEHANRLGSSSSSTTPPSALIPTVPPPNQLVAPAVEPTIGGTAAATVITPTATATALFRLFSVALTAVAKFNENEAVLRPHLRRLVLLCLRYALRSRQPQQFLLVLRVLFRVISGGKLDALMRELLPLLPQLLNGLHKLHERAEEEPIREILVELCLTVPARLSSMIPFLPLLMRLIGQALKGKPELANLGLRTLEFWVDNLNQDYLWPVLSQQPTVLTDLMTALTDHLKPQPYPYGHLAARLLGKLGGKNRLFLREPLPGHQARVMGKELERGSSLLFGSSFFATTSEASIGGTADLPLYCEWEAAEPSTVVPPVPAAEGEATQIPTDSPPPPPTVPNFLILPLDPCVKAVCSFLDRLVHTNPTTSTSASTPPAAAASPPTTTTPSKTGVAATDTSPPAQAKPESDAASVAAAVTSSALSSEALLIKHKDYAWQMIVSCLAALISTSDNASMANAEPIIVQAKPSMQAQFVEMIKGPVKVPSASTSTAAEEGTERKIEHNPLPELLQARGEVARQNTILRDLLTAIVTAAADQHLEAKAKALLQGLGIHFLLTLASHSHPRHSSSSSSTTSETEVDVDGSTGRRPRGNSEGGPNLTESSTGSAPSSTSHHDDREVGSSPSPTYQLDERFLETSINPLVLNEALLLCLVDPRLGLQDAGLWLIRYLAMSAQDLSLLNLKPTKAGGDGGVSAILMFEDLMMGLLKSCYLKKIRSKLGAARGLRELCLVMGTEWTLSYELQVVRDLLFILKDQPTDASAIVTEDVLDTILTIISLCHSPTSSSKKEKESKKKATSTTSSSGGGGGAAAGVVAMEVSDVEKEESGGGEQGPSSSSSFSSRSSALASSVASQLIRMLAMELECQKPAVRAAIKLIYIHLDTKCGVAVYLELAAGKDAWCKRLLEKKVAIQVMVHHHHAAARIGMIDAVTFYLRTTRPPTPFAYPPEPSSSSSSTTAAPLASQAPAGDSSSTPGIAPPTQPSANTAADMMEEDTTSATTTTITTSTTTTIKGGGATTTTSTPSGPPASSASSPSKVIKSFSSKKPHLFEEPLIELTDDLMGHLVEMFDASLREDTGVSSSNTSSSSTTTTGTGTGTTPATPATTTTTATTTLTTTTTTTIGTGTTTASPATGGGAAPSTASSTGTPSSTSSAAAAAAAGGGIACMVDDRGRSNGHAYDITPRPYLEEQFKRTAHAAYLLYLHAYLCLASNLWNPNDRWTTHVNDMFILGWTAHVNDMFLLGELPYPLQLRFYIIRLVTAIMQNRHEVFFAEAYKEIRQKFITLCFKTITMQCDPVVDAALQALTLMININKNIPKDILHNCLRPVLKNLQDYRLLTVPLLQGLLRMLYSLSQLNGRLFNVNFPEKLLEHLDNWTEPDRILSDTRVAVSGADRPPAWQEPEIAAAIIHLFHLIQPGQNFCDKFLDPLVKATVTLEASLPKYRYNYASGGGSSPFIVPLTKFLNRYAVEDRCADQTEEAVDLRRHLMREAGTNHLILTAFNFQLSFVSNPPLLKPGSTVIQPPSSATATTITTTTDEKTGAGGAGPVVPTFPSSTQQQPQQQAPPAPPAPAVPLTHASIRAAREKVDTGALVHNGLKIIHVLVKKDKGYLIKQGLIMKCLRQVWATYNEDPSAPPAAEGGEEKKQPYGAPASMPPSVFDTHHIRAQEDQRVLLKCFIEYCQANPLDVDALLEMLQVFVRSSLVNLSFVRDFFRKDVAQEYSSSQKRHVLSIFLRFLPDQNRSSEIKVLALQLIILPMLASTFENPLAANERVVDGAIIQGLMKDAFEPSRYEKYPDNLRISLLKLSTLLIEFLGKEFVDYRKELINFAWNHLRRQDDLIIKHWAYINVCRFIAVYETPHKIILQVYVSLLKAYQQDTRDLIRTALDILVPALPRRLPIPDYQRAVFVTRRALYEDGQVTVQLAHLAHILVQHPQLFYPYRREFVPPLISSLQRLSQPSGNVGAEIRQLGVALADLLISWEIHRRDRQAVNGLESGASPSLKRGLSMDNNASPEGNKRAKGESGTLIPMTSSAPAVLLTATAVGQTVLPTNDETPVLPFPHMVDLLLNFLVKNAVSTVDSKDASMTKISTTSLQLFRLGLELWASKDLRLSYFEKVLQSVPSHIAQTAQGSSNPNQETTPAVLVCALDVLLATMEYDEVHFVPKQLPKVAHFLVPCFSHHDDPEVRRRLGKFLAMVIKAYPPLTAPPAFLEPGSGGVPGVTFYQRVKEVVEKKLLAAVSEGLGDIAQRPGVPKAQAAAEAAAQAGLAGRCSAWPVIQILETIADVASSTSSSSTTPTAASAAAGAAQLPIPGAAGTPTAASGGGNSHVLEPYTPALVKLATRLARDHTAAAMVSTRPGAHQLLMMATPTMTLLDDAITSHGTGLLPGSSSSSTSSSSSSSSSSASTKQSEEAVQTLMGCIRLAGRCVGMNPSRLADQRKGLLAVMSACLDKSDSIPLLITIYTLVSEWTLGYPPPQTPSPSPPGPEATKAAAILATMTILQPKEKIALVAKMGLALDRLPELASQPLQALYFRFVLHLWQLVHHHGSSAPPTPSSSAGPTPMDVSTEGGAATARHTPPFWITQATVRSSIQGLMVADPSLRQEFLGMLYGPNSAVPRSAGGRLGHVLKQDWEAVGGRFWIVLVVDILLSAISQGSVRIPEGTKVMEAPVIQQKGGEQMEESEEAKTAAAKRQVACQAHETVMQQLVQSRQALGPQLIEAMRLLLHADLTLTKALWLPLIKASWSTLPTEKQESLVPGMVNVLAKGGHRQALVLPPYHTPPIQHQINTVQGLLQGFLSLRPIPALSPDLLGALAVNYNAWATVLPIVEYHVITNTVPTEKQPWLQVLCTLYHLMGEHDLRTGVRRRYCIMHESRYALGLETYGAIMDAQQMLFDLIQREAFSGGSRGASVGGGANLNPSSAFRGLPQFELEMWEERWIECARQLSQWPILAEFASATQHPELALECAWKSGDWESVRALIQGNQLLLQQETGSPAHRVHEARLAVADGRPAMEVDRALGQAFQLSLSKWQLFPRVYSGCPNHKGLLHVLHQLHEIKETVVVMDDAMMGRTPGSQGRDGPGGLGGGALPSLHTNLRFWRDRLPNEWDPINEWDDLLYWRLQVFERVQQRRMAAVTADGTGVIPDPARVAPEFQDTSWTMVRLARTARKKGLYDVALNLLCRIPMATMAVPDAFGKLREQVMVFHQSKKAPNELTPGLNIINHTNLDYFGPEQTAELFRLKGMFLASMDQRAEANQAFSHGMQICGTYGKGWLTWGRYSDELFEKEPSQRLLGLNAMACYLESINLLTEGSRLLISRVLQMLLIDEDSAAKVLERHGKGLPEWVWVPWVPNLITFLTRPGAPVVKSILKAVTNRYPQAVYCTVRAFFIERRDIQAMSASTAAAAAAAAQQQQQGKGGEGGGVLAGLPPQLAGVVDPSGASLTRAIVLRWPAPTPTASGPATPSSGAGAPGTPQLQPPTASTTAATVTFEVGRPLAEVRAAIEKGAIYVGPAPDPEHSSFHHAEDIVNQFRKSHPGLAHEIEVMLEEIITRFRQKQEEELLSTIHTLLQRCFQSVYMTLEDPTPQSLQDTLLRICNKYFKGPVKGGGGAGQQQQQAQQQQSRSRQALIEVYKTAFERDFRLDQAGKELSLHQVILGLRRWKQILLHRIINEQQSEPLPLYRCSTYLAAMRHEHPPSVVRPSVSGGVGSTELALKVAGQGSSAGSAAAGGPVEIPGQYATCPGQPHPEVHAKLLGFDPEVEVFYRQHCFQRRICMLGNDGRRYYFVAQNATPYITRSDERMMQLHWLLNRLMEQNHQAQKRSLHVKVPVVVPITPRLRLMEDDKLFTSLGEVYEGWSYAKGMDPDVPVMMCRERCSKAIKQAKEEFQAELAAQQGATIAEGGGAEEGSSITPTDPSVSTSSATAAATPGGGGGGSASSGGALTPAQQTLQQQRIEAAVKREKLAVFEEVTSNLVRKDIMYRYLQANFNGEAESMWAWQHAFASQLGISSLLYYAFACGDRVPHKLVFHKTNARVLSADLRPGYGPKGYLDLSEEVPFRLTPNLVCVLTPFLVDGLMMTTMTIVAQALASKREYTQPFLHLMIRDDILAWHASKSAQMRTEQEMRNIEKQLVDRVNRNVVKVLERLQQCAPALPNQGTTDVPQQAAVTGLVDHKTANLVETALNPKKVALMNPTWYPWL